MPNRERAKTNVRQLEFACPPTPGDVDHGSVKAVDFGGSSRSFEGACLGHVTEKRQRNAPKDQFHGFGMDVPPALKPMLKYRGGKSREIPAFQRWIPESFDTYFEPFLGGGAVYFYLRPSRAVLNDINGQLVNFYRTVRDNYPEMRNQLDCLEKIYEDNQTDYARRKSDAPSAHVDNANEKLYYRMRDIYNGKSANEYLTAVTYFFINKTAYSGMLRFNSDGEYNVPFGRYQHFNSHLITASHHHLLQHAQIHNRDYSEIFSLARPGDFMFLDPPYDCVFNDYGNLEQESGFGEAEQIRLRREFGKLKCKALMVIGKTPLTEKLYHGLIRDEYTKNYAVNIRNRFKSAARHLVITNYEDPS